jgi:hypothetical protein
LNEKNGHVVNADYNNLLGENIWIEDTEGDIQIMGIRGWRKLCKERMEWKRIIEKAKTHSGL